MSSVPCLLSCHIVCFSYVFFLVPFQLIPCPAHDTEYKNTTDSRSVKRQKNFRVHTKRSELSKAIETFFNSWVYACIHVYIIYAHILHISYYITHRYTNSHMHTHTWTHSHTLIHTPLICILFSNNIQRRMFFSHTDTPTPTNTHTYFHKCTKKQTDTHTVVVILSLSVTHIHVHNHIHTHTLRHAQIHTHSLAHCLAHMHKNGEKNTPRHFHKHRQVHKHTEW